MSWEQLKADAAYLDQNLKVLGERDQGFASSLLEQFNDRGLSEKQEYWVGELAKRARERVDAQARQVEEVKIDLTRIVELFKTAQTNLKKPFILVDDVVEPSMRYRLKLAGISSKYVGQVYVYSDGRYEDRLWLGRIDPERGVYVPSQQVRDWPGGATSIQKTLQAFAADPVGAAMRYGRTVGACCFCGRALHDPRSVTVGYGPICADSFGLPWGEVVEELEFQPSHA